ncbi:MAG: DUF1732 domain-containing protein [Deltaproteobacteria bacterium]|nr:DUF1732 domain-containing protein [Deltaproteobacteria bacterium]
MHSMTGFGVARGKVGRAHIVIEARSVNHRFCEVSLRFPGRFASLEPEVVRRVRERFSRGKFDLFLREEAVGREEEELLLAKRSHHLLQRIQKELGLSGFVKEQKKLLRLLTQIEKHSSSRGHEYRLRLKKRMRMTGPVDEQRITQEAAIAAERADVTEETVRLRSHLEEFERLFRLKEPVGRKFDFLVQEMGREVNTIGSKAQGVRVTHEVIEFKSELERTREQIQNIE